MALYICRIEWLIKTKSFIGPETLGFLMPMNRSIDLDTSYDWNLAEKKLKNK